jgi:CRP-like cAMP-binding protein
VVCLDTAVWRFSDARPPDGALGPDRPGGDNNVHAIDPGPLSNKLLAELPAPDFQVLVSHFTMVRLSQGNVLCETGDEIDQVYFPLSGMISLVVVMRDGKGIETAVVGREGVFGGMSGLGVHRSRVRAIVQLPMYASRIPSSHFRKVASSSKAVAELCVGYNEVLLEQARITAACNALHGVEARFCRWLLQTRDRAETDTFMLTQEFVSEMLGVRRTSITEVATKIQAAGAISYSRGIIKICDVEALKALSCECYETLKYQSSEFRVNQEMSLPGAVQRI